jgi:hypothetical protein
MTPRSSSGGAMNNPKVLKILPAFLAILLLGTLAWAGYLLWQNYCWRQEVSRFAASSGRVEATALFRNGKLWLYKMDGRCDDSRFSGQREGPFEIWIAFYQPALGMAHRHATECYVTSFNEQMRMMHLNAEKSKWKLKAVEKDAAPTAER